MADRPPKDVWAYSRALEARYGDASSDYAASELSAALAKGDEEDAIFWRAVRERLDELHHIAQPLCNKSILPKRD
jgi:hypothetical protein